MKSRKNLRTDAEKMNMKRSHKLKPWQQAVITAVAVFGVMGFAGVLVYMWLNPTIESADTSVSTGVGDSELTGDAVGLTLSDGENLISEGGIYHISGSTSNGYIHINNDDEEVKLILDNVSITYEDGPAIYVESNGNTYIELIGENTIDAKPTDDLNGAIYSKADLAIDNPDDDDATLTVKSTLDGIVGKDDLEINGGIFTITADDDGIVGKDSVKITDGEFKITATGLGIKTSNEEEKGDLEISGGTFTIKSEGKAIKSEGNILLAGGKFTITSTDDAVHSNSSLTITDGEFTISTGDDGIHADKTAIISGGDINVQKSYEALEANIIEINGGDLNLVASDDGINANNSDGSTAIGVQGDGSLTITDGDVYVNADGDGLDSNGTITISGGTIYVDGPTSGADGAMDCDGTITITGGTLIAVGSSGMAQNASSATQATVLINLSSSYSDSFTFGDISYSPAKTYQSILISSSDLTVGKTYDLKIDGETVTSVTLSDTITTSGSQSNAPGGGGNMRAGGRR